MKYILCLILIAITTGCVHDITYSLWDNGMISYTISDQCSTDKINTIRDAMDEWEVTGVTFSEGLGLDISCNDLLVSSATIGQNNYNNWIKFGVEITKRSAMHELGHVLGLHHEHQRPGRDNYVQVNWDNIWEPYHHNFDIQDNTWMDESTYSYDYCSIMHYGTTTFGTSSAPALTLLHPASCSVGHESYLSTTDIQKVTDMYYDEVNK